MQPIETIGKARPTFGWFSDFGWEGGRLVLRQTGIRLALDRHVVAELGHWLVYLALLGVVAAKSVLSRRSRPSVWFIPNRPRPWYLIRGAALWSGVRTARSEAEADIAFYFEDTTTGVRQASTLPVLNGGCTDVSKSRVARVFEQVFGCALSLDPRLVEGDVVEKSERNGVHDGRVVQAPCAPRPGYVYQKCIDSTDHTGACHDLRTLCIGGRPLLVWVKEKPAGTRFTINNSRAVLCRPETLFSPKEIDDIALFCDRMGLDWGGLDILRDRHNGQIYIVDVNKTDLGPVIALSWSDKIRSMGLLGDALRDLIASRQARARQSTSPGEPHIAQVA